MAELEVRARAGKLRVIGADSGALREAASLVLAPVDLDQHVGELIEFAGGRAYLKKTCLRGKARVRYTLKQKLLRMRLPCEREHDNLRWLRARLFQAPEPLAAGVFTSGGAPLFQFLLTSEVPRARTLDAFLEAAPSAERAHLGAERTAVLDELAREVARMHALGFIHHDLFPRNLLVTPEGPSRLWFIDCWAGGPPPQLRGVAYDLGCLTLQQGVFSADEVQRFLTLYGSERAVHDRPVDLARVIADTERARAALERRQARARRA